MEELISPQFQRDLKAWARKYASRIRRPDMADDFESAGLVFFFELGRIDWGMRAALERHARESCSLKDDMMLARDSDLTARVNERAKDRGDMASYMEELIADPHTEEDLLSVLDGEPRVEGRDQAELLDEIEEASTHHLSLQEDSVLTYIHFWGAETRDLAREWDCTPSTARKRVKRIERKVQLRTDVARLLARVNAEPDFTQMEVRWVTL